MKKLLYMILIFTAVQMGWGENVSITQIDASSLLFNQNITMFVSVTDDNGSPLGELTQGSFDIAESVDGEEYKESWLVDFSSKAVENEGIHFLFLIDNSGSMYYAISGEPTRDVSRWRITKAKKALKGFIDSIKNPRDTITLASFNTNLKKHAANLEDLTTIDLYLETITAPEEGEEYTELYGALLTSIEEFSALKGRKVIVLLSDGVNDSYFVDTGKDHPVWGQRVFNPQEVGRGLSEEGITLFAVNFSPQRDLDLQRLALESGGRNYDARSEEELTGIYIDIRDLVLNEYRVVFRANMDAADKKFVRVTYSDVEQNITVTSKRYYFSSTLFGIPENIYPPFLLIPFIIALVLWFFVSKIKVENTNISANLEVLYQGSGRVDQNTLILGTEQTVIGSSKDAGLTIMGAAAVKENHATIVYNEKKDIYTVVSDTQVKVNNKIVKERDLEPGDVINIEGTIIVFDK